MPVEGVMLVEEFYGTKKTAFRGFSCPAPRERWHDRNIYETLEKLWEMPDACWTNKAPITLVQDSAVVDARTVGERFLEQAKKLQKETQHFSSPSQRMMHPSYQAILGMGNEHPQEIIRLMIEDMQQNRTPWFWALSYLAQDNPVSQSDAGKTDKMIKAWVDWEKARRTL
jgi:hypothetical protein